MQGDTERERERGRKDGTVTPQHSSPLAEHSSFIKDRELTAPYGLCTIFCDKSFLSAIVHLMYSKWISAFKNAKRMMQISSLSLIRDRWTDIGSTSVLSFKAISSTAHWVQIHRERRTLRQQLNLQVSYSLSDF